VLAAVTNSLPGDLINGLPGEHNCGTNNILRAGRNYDFSGASVVWTNTAQANSQRFKGYSMID
jgi:hypothetical protein